MLYACTLYCQSSSSPMRNTRGWGMLSITRNTRQVQRAEKSSLQYSYTLNLVLMSGNILDSSETTFPPLVGLRAITGILRGRSVMIRGQRGVFTIGFWSFDHSSTFPGILWKPGTGTGILNDFFLLKPYRVQ